MSTRPRRKDREPLNQLVGTIATVPTATGDIPSLVGSHPEPTHDDIARRAYQCYEERGGEHGLDQEDWLQAERELQQLVLHDSLLRIRSDHVLA
jgi:hypothetical protein